MLEQLPFVQGYGVDLGLLIDVAGPVRPRGDRPGRPRACAIHRNRPLDELSPQALAVMQTAFTKANLGLASAHGATLVRPGLLDTTIEHVERPRLTRLEAYRRRLA